MKDGREHRPPSGTDSVALIGYMGSGKTTVGRLLARDLGLDFVDLDREIERVAGMPISEIFSAKGESGFRDMEHEVLKEAVGREGAVISCGGGIVVREENRELLGEISTVFLKEDLDVLFRRTRRADRPLRGGGFKEFENRYREREAHYREAAHLVVRPEGRRQEAVVREISYWLQP